MPLKPGSTRTAIEANIAELIGAGYPKKQAIAIALRTARADRKTGDPSVPSIVAYKPRWLRLRDAQRARVRLAKRQWLPCDSGDLIRQYEISEGGYYKTDMPDSDLYFVSWVDLGVPTVDGRFVPCSTRNGNAEAIGCVPLALAKRVTGGLHREFIRRVQRAIEQIKAQALVYAAAVERAGIITTATIDTDADGKPDASPQDAERLDRLAEARPLKSAIVAETEKSADEEQLAQLPPAPPDLQTMRQNLTVEIAYDIIKTRGFWDAAEAHIGYTEESPFQSIAVKCASCVFWRGEGRCALVTAEAGKDIAPKGYCRLYIGTSDDA